MLVRKAVLLLTLLVCLAAGASAQASGPPTTVAVLYFDYDGTNEEMGFLRKGLAQMLVTDLTGTPGIQVVERARLEAVMAELDLGKTKRMDSKTAAKIGKMLGAHQLVLGGYFDLRGTLRIDARVIDVATTKVLRSVGVNRKVDDFLALEAKLASELKAFFSSEAAALSGAGATTAQAPVKPIKVSKTAKRRTGKGAKTTSPKVAKPSTNKPAANPVDTNTIAEAPARGSAEVAAASEVATESTDLPKVHARSVARYGMALDKADNGDEARARAILLALVKEVPEFKAPQIDLKRFLK